MITKYKFLSLYIILFLITLGSYGQSVDVFAPATFDIKQGRLKKMKIEIWNKTENNISVDVPKIIIFDYSLNPNAYIFTDTNGIPFNFHRSIEWAFVNHFVYDSIIETNYCLFCEHYHKKTDKLLFPKSKDRIVLKSNEKIKRSIYFGINTVGYRTPKSGVYVICLQLRYKINDNEECVMSNLIKICVRKAKLTTPFSIRLN